jgi:hypothetical protein
MVLNIRMMAKEPVRPAPKAIRYVVKSTAAGNGENNNVTRPIINCKIPTGRR